MGKLQNNHKGFTLVEGLLIVLVLTAIVGVGFYVMNANKNTTAGKSAQTSTVDKQATKASTPKLTTYAFPQEKMQFSYDNSYWKIADQTSGNIDCQGGALKSDTLSLAHGDFTLSYRFGQCGGKGGGICFDEANSGCIRESKKLGEVQVSSGKTLYVLGSRSTTDSGKTWEYDLFVNHKSDCTAATCTLPASNIDDNLSSISGSYSNKSTATSLDEYVQLPEVKAAVELLKTTTY